jgi:hypothetical protein
LQLNEMSAHCSLPRLEKSVKVGVGVHAVTLMQTQVIDEFKLLFMVRPALLRTAC